MTDHVQTDSAARDAEFERFCEQITMASVGETVAKLLTHPFGFHGDTGIRDYLYARLHMNGGDRLDADDPRPGFSTLLLQSEHYTRAQYIGIGQSPSGARFDLALTRPPKPSDGMADRCAERLEALFAFELGKNKTGDKVIDPGMLAHAVDATPGTSDVSKLYRELVHHDLKQGWAIEFYDSRRTSGVATVTQAMRVCRGLTLPEGKKLVVVFVAFSLEGAHLVASNDDEVQATLLALLAGLDLEVESDPAAFSARSAAGPNVSGRSAGRRTRAADQGVRGAARSFVGGVRKEFVYIPSVEPKSFMHLSTRGDSYALRTFSGGPPEIRYRVAGCETLSELIACHRIQYSVDVAADPKTLKGEDRYWANRTAELNREYGIDGGTAAGSSQS